MEILPPTKDDIFEEQVELVHRKLDDSWRHGNYVNEVYHREEDDTYWNVAYRVSGDGESNDLRDGNANITRVKPVTRTITVTEYVVFK